LNTETKRGRPKKKVFEKRVQQFTLRLKPIEYGRLRMAARERNMTMAKFIRLCLSEYLDS